MLDILYFILGNSDANEISCEGSAVMSILSRVKINENNRYQENV